MDFLETAGLVRSGGRGRKFTPRSALTDADGEAAKLPFHRLAPTNYSTPFQSLSRFPAQVLSFAGASLWKFCGDCRIPFPSVDRINIYIENII